MTDVTAKRFDEMESAVGGMFVRARAELGVRAFGMQVFNLPPGFDAPFSAHTHAGLPPELAFADHGPGGGLRAARGPRDADRRRRALGARAGHGGPGRAEQLRQIVTGDEPLQLPRDRRHARPRLRAAGLHRAGRGRRAARARARSATART